MELKVMMMEQELVPHFPLDYKILTRIFLEHESIGELMAIMTLADPLKMGGFRNLVRASS
jgi:hypothetical protein